MIVVKHITAAWTNIEDTLTDISFSIEKGKLYAIIGSIGSGKVKNPHFSMVFFLVNNTLNFFQSSLLHLFLNEISIKEGAVNIYGSISYGSQNPWLFVDTIRNNILFGEIYDSERYEKVFYYVFSLN